MEAPFRDLSIPMLEEVRRYTERADTIVNVVIPEYIVAKWWQLPLHNQTALFVKRLFLFEQAGAAHERLLPTRDRPVHRPASGRARGIGLMTRCGTVAPCPRIRSGGEAR